MLPALKGMSSLEYILHSFLNISSNSSLGFENSSQVRLLQVGQYNLVSSSKVWSGAEFLPLTVKFSPLFTSPVITSPSNFPLS